ncbi:erythromycin esterase family protein [Segetibacter sp. 3557_3]|uniref:erythromycin esterase family protein n=1 Tax=Segetibacter sp. 3557_3 TaxID=2547429 RepID=UPI001058E99E|nr:erythromycin esterase family protein [Segetibacter sp. 3557_3]TDH29016.1 erythromycin esterase family protein [Segetibacter sp. 3557_3]
MKTRTTSKGLDESAAISEIIEHQVKLESLGDLQPLFDAIGEKRIVMLGEASHGTHEYYTWRSFISQRLIAEKGFSFIAVEGDWPDCYKINEYVKGRSHASTAQEVVKTFDRWPTWMWANWEIAGLAEWLKKYNAAATKKIGFYGIDVYSLWESLGAIRQYLQEVDPIALEKVSETFRCFEPYSEDGVSYAYASRLVPELCENEVVALLKELKEKLPTYDSGEESVFSTEQNALIAVNAEKYYRAMVKGDGASWNVRDGHMQETLDRLLEFNEPGAKTIVWAHNTHIGDASATDMQQDGMINIGELSRQKYGNDTFLVGFGSYKGSVIAGKRWGAPMQKMELPPAPARSWERLLHKAGAGDKLLLMHNLPTDVFDHHIGHRAVGVVYNPALESYGNYVPSRMTNRYDAFIHLDQTRALHPLHLEPHNLEIPDTYPFGM